MMTEGNFSFWCRECNHFMFNSRKKAPPKLSCQQRKLSSFFSLSNYAPFLFKQFCFNIFPHSPITRHYCHENELCPVTKRHNENPKKQKRHHHLTFHHFHHSKFPSFSIFPFFPPPSSLSREL